MNMIHWLLQLNLLKYPTSCGELLATLPLLHSYTNAESGNPGSGGNIFQAFQAVHSIVCK